MGRFLILSAVILGLGLPPTLAMAQRERGHGTASGHGSSSGGFSGSHDAPSIFRGGPRGNMGWGAFHHDTAPARVSPHRFGGTNLPRPNAWRGNIHNFDLPAWRRGAWQHVSHNGRLGWWWVVGPSWYFFGAPMYPYPDIYTPYNQPIGWWYWCDPYQEYYPYVTWCPVPWESVMPRE